MNPDFYSESEEKSLKLSSQDNNDMIDEKMSDEDQESSDLDTQVKTPKNLKFSSAGSTKRSSAWYKLPATSVSSKLAMTVNSPSG
jgi:alpha-tubulin suppressor-like RCC1 family protein